MEHSAYSLAFPKCQSFEPSQIHEKPSKRCLRNQVAARFLLCSSDISRLTAEAESYWLLSEAVQRNRAVAVIQSWHWGKFVMLSKISFILIPCASWYTKEPEIPKTLFAIILHFIMLSSKLTHWQKRRHQILFLPSQMVYFQGALHTVPSRSQLYYKRCH